MSSKRKTLRDGNHPAIYGRHGKRVRALEEIDSRGHRRVLVTWAENGSSRKKVFDATPDGRKEAIAYARGFSETRGEKEKGRAAPITLGELFDLYAQAEFDHMRRPTQINYRSHWKKWEVTWGATFPATLTTLQMLIQFRTGEKKLGRAPNQIRQTINIVKIVYAWAALHDLIPVNKVALYRWKRAKNEKKLEPGEYSPVDYEKLLLAVDPNLGTEWRIWVMLALINQHGVRANAVRNLAWTDVTPELVTWPGEFQKNGEPLVQPVTFETWAALETARYWQKRLGIESPWVLPGTARTGGKPYTYGAAHKALLKAEQRAEIEHQDYRAFHGGRRMVVGNITDATGDARLAMQYVGDRDLKQLPSYLKVREERTDRAAAVMSSGSPKASPNRPPSARRSRSLKQKTGSDVLAGASERDSEPLVGFEPTTATSTRPPLQQDYPQGNDLEASKSAETPEKTPEPSLQNLPRPSPVTRPEPDRGGR